MFLISKKKVKMKNLPKMKIHNHHLHFKCKKILHNKLLLKQNQILLEMLNLEMRIRFKRILYFINLI